jgi:hypothetical protein
MRFSSARRLGLLALLAVLFAAVSQPSQAQTGNVHIRIVKAGWFVGAQAGSGTLRYGGRVYRLEIGGLSAGLTFGGSAAEFVGTASNLRRVTDIEGVYTAVGAGLAVVGGVRIARMRNARGVLLTLRGRQVGLHVDVDLSGMAISLR